ncbi:MAG: galactokinase [Bacillota bacterium]|nr:MAG: galactokinase [Bacillota bacterium]
MTRNIDDLKNDYKKIFSDSTDYEVYYSPGRVNLIGEHIDYNGGLVFPAAISIGTYGVVGKRSDQQFYFYSANYPDEGLIKIDLDDLTYKKEHGWANYAKGILYELKQRGYHLPYGFNLFVEGNLPTASGLSSSASLEVLVSYIANELYDLNMTRTDMALLSQSVENGYMGMHCGIMDQLIIANGIKDHALLMDTSTLQMTPSKATFDGYTLIIMNTNYKRKTTDSKYNERVSECSQALKIIQKSYDITYLCELKTNDLDAIEKLLKDPILYRRVRHTITEQQRTLDAMDAMKAQDALLFGKLLDESHASLKNDYEVTGLHLDTLVLAAKNAGAVGARVTGAGFGGCAIALVLNDQVNRVKDEVYQMYLDKTGIEPAFYIVTFTDGVNKIKHD